jgi:polyferredoxin
MSKPQGAALYEAAEKIYPREIGGRFDRLSRIATITLLGLFYAVPWLPWDERQAVLFDLPARKFYIFGLTLWPQDFPYLALLLMILAYCLFFFTAIGGRLWCGFACPQTVWTEIFIWMEQFTEGTRSQRMKLDKAPWSWNKFRR